jgi:hypothetical protein
MGHGLEVHFLHYTAEIGNRTKPEDEYVAGQPVSEDYWK